jgi:hypothetical protein
MGIAGLTNIANVHQCCYIACCTLLLVLGRLTALAITQSLLLSHKVRLVHKCAHFYIHPFPPHAAYTKALMNTFPVLAFALCLVACTWLSATHQYMHACICYSDITVTDTYYNLPTHVYRFVGHQSSWRRKRAITSA